MQKFNLIEIFRDPPKDKYSIIKLPHVFPDYEFGGDIDIFCQDINAFSRHLIKHLNNLITEDIFIKVKKNNNQTHVDIIEGGKLNFRFDLLGEFPKYKNINIKPSFFDIIIENSVPKDFNKFSIYIPQIYDECILRYIEYIEYIEKRPEKLKHLEYLESKITHNNLDLDYFIERLFYYTALPQPEYLDEQFFYKIKKKTMFFRETLLKANDYLKKNGFIKTIKKIINRLK